MIVSFVVCDKITGKILSTGSAPAEMVSLQAQAGEMVVVGQADDECDWVHPGSRTIRRNHITTREEIRKKEKLEWEKEAPIREREELIQNKLRQMAIEVLMQEGKLEE